MHNLTISLQALVASSVFFVWVIRYANIVQEFKQYGLPDWLKDLVGILKMNFSLMLLIGIERPFFAVRRAASESPSSWESRSCHSSAGEKPGVQDVAQSDIAGFLNGNRFD